MKLYYSKGACSLVVRIILNELNIPCEYESVDLKTKKTESGADFLKINSKGAVPVLAVDSHEIITENTVILQYLADQTKAIHLLPEVGNFQRYRVLEWLNYITTELHKSFGPLFNPSVPQEMKEQFFIPLLQSKFNYVNIRLENHSFLLEDHFTLPDAYLFVMLLWATHFKFDLNQWGNIARFFQALNQRPSIQKSLAQEGLFRGA